MKVGHWVEWNDGPVTAEAKVCARIFQVTPGLPIGPAPFSEAELGDTTVLQPEWRMAELYGSNNTQFLEAWHVFWLAHFHMLDAMTTIPPSVHPLNGCIAIQRLPHCAIPATMD